MRLLVHFMGGLEGQWRVLSSRAVVGAPLEAVPRLAIREGERPGTCAESVWELRGVTSNQRYAERAEAVELRNLQAGLRRPEATHAALIPIKKSEAWWALAQDERREIFEQRSRHIAGTSKYLPAIARRLHHGRDLGERFDFLTWFEFAPEHDALFDELLGMLRATPEWDYVEQEVDIRLTREPG